MKNSKISLFCFCTFLFLAALPQAQANTCTDRDYRGLKLDSAPPPLGESICQFKLLLKSTNDQDSLRQFLALQEELIGMGPKDVNWSQPLVPIINDIINQSLADGRLNKLAAAAQKFYGEGSRYRLEKEDLDLINLLAMIDIQHGGRH